MSSFNKLNNTVTQKKSMLCVGLDSDIKKIPNCFEKNINGLFEFNKTIIEATKAYCSAYKINFAFYEQYGSEGFELIKRTLELIPSEIFTIADAKRGDIGNTSEAYAQAVFGYFGFDSVTVNPYMGFDSISPFLFDKSKFVFLLALTSNAGSYDFQRLISDGKPLYQHVVEKSAKKFAVENIGFVIGATHPTELFELRKIIPESAILIPGIGAQGGDIAAIQRANGGSLALINVSRAIIYPHSSTVDISCVEFKEIVQANTLNFQVMA